VPSRRSALIVRRARLGSAGLLARCPGTVRVHVHGDRDLADDRAHPITTVERSPQRGTLGWRAGTRPLPTQSPFTRARGDHSSRHYPRRVRVKSPPDAERTYIADVSRSGGNRALNSAVPGFLAISGCASPARTPALPADGTPTTSSQPASKPQELTAPRPTSRFCATAKGRIPRSNLRWVDSPRRLQQSTPDGPRITDLRASQGLRRVGGPVYSPDVLTALAISLTNSSPHAINLNQVVVTAMYETPARIAQPAYKATPVGTSPGRFRPDRPRRRYTPSPYQPTRYQRSSSWWTSTVCTPLRKFASAIG
jgi:hypothetical protein